MVIETTTPKLNLRVPATGQDTRVGASADADENGAGIWRCGWSGWRAASTEAPQPSPPALADQLPPVSGGKLALNCNLEWRGRQTRRKSVLIEKGTTIINFTLLWVFLPVLLYVAPTSLRAQRDKPTIVVSMYFVSEKVACPPNGYDESGGQTLACRQLTFEDLEQMTSQRIARRVQQSIPPEQLRLGRSLMYSLEAFSEDCPINTPCTDQPERRYSIVLAFEVKGAQDFDGYEITIRRIPPSDSRFEGYSRSGILSDRGRWINHQRADVFLPSNGVRWVLQLGEWNWNLGTEP